MIIDNHFQTISSHDLLSAITQLKKDIHGLSINADWSEEIDHLRTLELLLVEAATRAGSPENFLLIHGVFWKEWCEDYASGMGPTTGWPYDNIDWDKASEALKLDYGCIDFGGATYFVRM
jgi:hypothetical protein